MFDYAGVSDGHQSQHIPDYEPVMFKIRIGLRKTKNLMKPLENRELFSVNNKPLNPCLKDLFNMGTNARDSDIRKILRTMS